MTAPGLEQKGTIVLYMFSGIVSTRRTERRSRRGLGGSLREAMVPQKEGRIARLLVPSPLSSVRIEDA
jgi:hypothetical protein